MIADGTLSGLSWLIGSSLADVLTSIIFLFIKHPFDVGDRVDLPEGSYTVKQIDLLSTIFLDSQGTLVQAPNTVLSTLVSVTRACTFIIGSRAEYASSLCSSSRIYGAAANNLNLSCLMSRTTRPLNKSSNSARRCYSSSARMAVIISLLST